MGDDASGENLMEKHVFLAQIDLVSENLNRVDELLHSGRIPQEGGFQTLIGAKFRRGINPLAADLKGLEERVRKTENDPHQLAGAWREFARLRDRAQRVFAQCLDLLGGVAVRSWMLDKDISKVAEWIVKFYAGETGMEPVSVTILGEDRLFDELFHMTRIIRLRFPEWEVWSLPFIGYEFGQLVALSREAIPELGEQQLARIRRLVTEAGLPPEELVGLASDVVEARGRYQQSPADEQAELLEEFMEKQRRYLRSLFADAFATYFVGPAYIYARLYLRLSPTQAAVDSPYTPSTARSVAFMLATLEKMNEGTKRHPYTPGVYDGELKRFRALWARTVGAAHAAPASILEPPSPYDAWFEDLFQALRRNYARVGFTPEHWKQAEKLAEGIFADDAAERGGVSNEVVLNAAWICRRDNPDRPPSDIEKRVKPLFAEAPPSSTGPGKR